MDFVGTVEAINFVALKRLIFTHNKHKMYLQLK